MPRFSPILLAVSLCAASIFSTQAADGPAPVAATPLVRGGARLVSLQADLKGAKELFLVVTDGGDGISADWADWVEPVLIKADGSKIPLTEIPWTSAMAGWGAVNLNKSAGGKALRVNGAVIPFGIGTHAPSLIYYSLPDGIVALETKAGIDNGGSDQKGGTVIFQVYTKKPAPSVLQAAQAANAPEKAYGFAAAKEGMKDFTVAPGLAVGLFAAEPQIQNPTNIDIDPQGRVWAVEAVNYRTTMKPWGMLREEGDRVVILEDTDGDGVADKETTFWQSPELKAPLGICVLPQEHGTKVIVSAAPNVWLLTDSTGAGHADKVQKLFTVGGNWDHDHQIHAFSFGADGKFYFNCGNEAHKLMDPDGNVITDLAGNQITTEGKPYRMGLVLRCDIDLEAGKASNVETLAFNFRNNFKVAVDSFGTMWQSDNDDDGNKGVRINYVMQFGSYGYSDEMTGAGWKSPRTNMETEIPLQHWHQNDPGTIPNLLQTGGGSPTGILVNEGTLLGPQFTNQMIHCDAGPRVVRAYPVTNDGAGYKAEIVNILTSEDTWYRPADACIAPDGSLFVADWYDPGVGGHNMGDHEKGHIRGRIYRVAPPELKYPRPSVDFASVDGCIAALQSPNRATQYEAWQRLHTLGAAAVPALQGLAKSQNPRFRARALGVLAHTPASAVAALRAGLNDQDPNVRIAAIRDVTSLARVGGFDASSFENDPSLLQQLTHDPNPQVRREIALSLHGSRSFAPLWTVLALQHDGNDRWNLESLGIGAAGHDDECFQAWLTAVGGEAGKWNTPGGRDLIWRLRTPKTAPFLVKIISDPATTSPEMPRYLRAFDFMPASEEKTKALVERARLGAKNPTAATEALQRLKGTDLDTNAELKNAVTAMLESAKGTAQFVELVKDFHLKGEEPGLLALVLARPASAEGIESAKMLLGDARPLIVQTLKGAEAGKLIEGLGNSADIRAVPLLTALVLDETREAALRKQAVRSLAQSPGGVEAILKLGREGKLPESLRLTATGALAAVQMPKYKKQISELFPAPNALGGQALPSIPQLVALKGNASHGKELFERETTTCITCHRVGSVGVDFAPALSEIGTKLGRDAIFESIIDPNAGIAMGFETTQLTLKDGSAAIGIVRSETADELVLAMPRGVQVKYKKSEIGSREKLANSMMPSGLNQTLSVQDLVDLVEYLSTLKAPAQAAR